MHPATSGATALFPLGGEESLHPPLNLGIEIVRPPIGFFFPLNSTTSLRPFPEYMARAFRDRPYAILFFFPLNLFNREFFLPLGRPKKPVPLFSHPGCRRCFSRGSFSSFFSAQLREETSPPSFFFTSKSCRSIEVK